MILTIIYLLLVLVILACLVWNMIESEKITDKILAGVMVILLLLRLFMIK